MNTKLIVTVAIASCNNAPYIERCVDSIIHQSYNNLDILIVDDGSKDDTIDKIEKFTKDSRLRIIIKENGGLSSVRQRALEEAKGDYICFIDADDYLRNDYVKTMLSQIVSDNSDICICSTLFENEDGSINEKDTQAFAVMDRLSLKVTNDLLSSRNSNLSGLLSLSDSWNKMYRTSFLKGIGVKFNLPKGFNGSDLVFNHKVALFEPQYSFVSAVEYCHVLYKKSAVRRKKKELQQGFQFIISDITNEAYRANCIDKLKGKIVNLHYYLLRYALQDRLNETEGLKLKLNEISKSRNMNTLFVEQNVNLVNKVGFMETNSLKAFYMLFHYMPFFLPLFFSIRKKLTE